MKREACASYSVRLVSVLSEQVSGNIYMYIALLNGKWRLLPLDISPQSHDGYRKHSDIR